MGWVRTGIAAAVGLAVGVTAAARLLDGEGASALGVAVAPAPVAGGAAIVGPVRVVDGDTLAIGTVRIRIQGIDAPEMDDHCLRPDGSAWECGVWSTRLARERFEGRQMVCHDLGERSHDRVVGRCLLGEEDFAEAMLQAGAAKACERFAKRHDHSRGYMALEAEAAAAGIGIFAGTPPPRAGFCTPRRAEAAPQSLPHSPSQAQSQSLSRPQPDRRLAAGDCAIKGNINSAGERIYHLPGQAHYDRVIIRPEEGQRWFCSSEEAEAAGWRRSLR